ncbi:type VI secretion system baseplate subunit TssG [Marinobacterium arenosum]|uniref:type VI secretion system baseplate subunit TssG n=1 Tax=Marinobacterium arenosum TaxID=2862496 RepID=UPI001C9625E6|nr:type VI secretion system baseplate subunit TssG [Marinobacterium arenosum]MBY4677079.1 type VI secretion system baseplate subunit TssG [Marinobacterium arenosum]
MSLSAELQRQPQRFDFIQVIRLLRRMAQSRDLQLSAEPMPDGTAREVQAIEHRGSESRIRLGLEALSGARGVIPNYLYEELLASLHQEDPALEQFLDIFNQRYYRLLHGELEKGNLLVREEQEQVDAASLVRLPQRDCLTRLAALPGHRAGDPDLLRYSVLLGLKVRSLSGLRQLLSDYFQLQVHVSVLDSSRYRLPATSLTRLGGRDARNNRLGQGVLLGRHGTLHFHRLEVRVEPRDRSEFVALQADPEFAGRLRELVRAYLRETTDLKLYLYVKRAFIAQPQLSCRPETAVRLGEANCLAPQAKPGEYRKILLQ